MSPVVGEEVDGFYLVFDEVSVVGSIVLKKEYIMLFHIDLKHYNSRLIENNYLNIRDLPECHTYYVKSNKI